MQGISQAVGYSPWYCSCMFHDVTGMTLKTYVTGRRIARITEEIRDTKERIIDIAIKYGFSSQEALTRAFKEQYGCTPAAYRKENLAFSFNPAELGYEWNEEKCQIYQRHYPEKLGYQVVRPVRKIKE